MITKDEKVEYKRIGVALCLNRLAALFSRPAHAHDHAILREYAKTAELPQDVQAALDRLLDATDVG